MSKDRVLKLSLCGDCAVGKTTLGLRLSERTPESEYVTTIGVDVYVRHLSKYKARIHIWDLAGQDRFRDITYCYVRGSDVLLYVYDILNFKSISVLHNLHKAYKDEGISDIKAIVVGNKSDLETRYNSCIMDGMDFARKLNAPHIVVSAKKGKDVDKLLKAILDMANTCQNPLLVHDPVASEKSEERVSNIEEIVRSCNNCVII